MEYPVLYLSNKIPSPAVSPTISPILKRDAEQVHQKGTKPPSPIVSPTASPDSKQDTRGVQQEGFKTSSPSPITSPSNSLMPKEDESGFQERGRVNVKPFIDKSDGGTLDASLLDNPGILSLIILGSFSAIVLIWKLLRDITPVRSQRNNESASSGYENRHIHANSTNDMSGSELSSTSKKHKPNTPSVRKLGLIRLLGSLRSTKTGDKGSRNTNDE